MTSYPRIVAIVLVLLSQVTAGAAVMCDEGLGRLVMELFPERCCDAGFGAGQAAPVVGPEEAACGPCLDVALAPVLQREEVRRDSSGCQPLVATALWTPPPAQPLAGGPEHDGTTSDAAHDTTIARLARTVVLRC